MSIVPYSAAALLKGMGVAQVFVGDPLTAGGMAALGLTEGEVRVEAGFETNDLTAPEWTGAAVHNTTIRDGAVSITVPLILGDPALWAKISPRGTRGGGFSAPQAPVEMSVLVIPLTELGTGISYPVGGPWAPAAPQNAFWLWRAYATHGPIPYRFDAGGKVITEVVFHGMLDVTKPEGHKLYTIGDPRTVTPTAIPVVI